MNVRTVTTPSGTYVDVFTETVEVCFQIEGCAIDSLRDQASQWRARADRMMRNAVLAELAASILESNL